MDTPIYEAPAELIKTVHDELDGQTSRERFREIIQQKQKELEFLIEKGVVYPVHDQHNIHRYDVPENYQYVAKLTHIFTPIHEEYGCCAYARQIVLPKGSLVIGKIHRHQHLNFFMNGKVTVYTEAGREYFDGPKVFVSETGTKRAVFSHEEAIWTTVHLTKFAGEENLDKIEEEVIAPTYEDLGLIPYQEVQKVESK
jgi:hypothetical protein